MSRLGNMSALGGSVLGNTRVIYRPSYLKVRLIRFPNYLMQCVLMALHSPLTRAPCAR